MDFSYPATLAWPALRHLFLWSVLLLWQYGIFVFLCSPADWSDSYQSDRRSDDSTGAYANDECDSWSDYDDSWSDDDDYWFKSNHGSSGHSSAWGRRVHSLSSHFEPLHRRFYSYSFPRYWPKVGCRAWHRPDPDSRDIPWTADSKAIHRQLRLSSSAVLSPSNTPLNRNITKAFERAPGIWPP